VRSTDPRLLALLDEPVARHLRAAAAGTPCHLVGGLLRDRLLGLAGTDFDAVVAANGLEIAERLARDLPARLVHLGGKVFAAYRLAGNGFTLDIWDRQGQSLETDLARRDFTVNAFALDVADRQVSDPFDGLADLEQRRLRATTGGVFADDPLRVLRLVRLFLQLPGFSTDPATRELARRSSRALAGVAAERVRDELGKVLRARAFHSGFELLLELEVYPRLFLGRVGRPLDGRRTDLLLRRIEPALEHLADLGRLPHGSVEPSGPRLAALISGLAATPGAAEAALESQQAKGYLNGREAARCRRLLGCRATPVSVAAARWFLHLWGEDWPAATAMLAATSEPPLAWTDWRRLQDRLAELAELEAATIFAPPALLDGAQIGRLLGIDPGPAIGAAVERLRRAQVEGRVSDRAGAETLLRSPASDAG
jgi:tRNA nucleotidyltransferase/poly(A) polymerase